MCNEGFKVKMMTRVFTEKLAVRWGDIDALRHVNHSVYFSYFEQARAHWMRSSNLLEDSTTIPVVVSASAQYRQAIYYPQALQVHIGIAGMSQRSITTTYELCADDEKSVRFATGEVVLVWIDREATKAVRLPQAVRDYVANALESR